jgi:hypothetical protein
METVTITASQLAKLLGLDSTKGIFDITMDAWDGPECVIKVVTCPADELVSKGLH